MIFETERLILREMKESDFDSLYAVLADSDIMQHYPYTFDEARVKNWIVRNRERYYITGFGLWSVCLKDTGEMIGDCGLTMQNINGRICPEIGYHIRRDFQRQGYAKEAAGAVRDWAFQNTPFRRLYSYMKHTNAASYSTAMSIGMTYICEYEDESNKFTKIYSISREEWLCMKNAWNFEKADASDKLAVKSLYDSLKNTQFCLWDEEYPSEKNIEIDLASGNLYILKNRDEIIGVVSIVLEDELDDFDFWKKSENAVEIARVGVSTKFQGNGIAGVLICQIEKELLKRGYDTVRLLVAKNNIPAYKTYIKAGFEVKGECYMYDNYYYACEKILEKNI